MVIFASPRFFERGRPRDLRGKAASMRMGESSKATVLQNELYTWICKTGFRVACLTSLLAFRSLGIRRHPRRFAPCQLDEGWSSPKTFVLLRNHAKAERRLRYLARRRCRRPHPLARSRGIHNLGRLVMAEDSQDCHVAGRTHAKKKNMENLEECHCVSARGQDGGQTIRVPSVMTRGRLYTPSHRARGRRNPFGGSCSAATYCRSAKTTGSVAGVETTRSVSMSSSGAVRRAASAPGSRAAANSRRHARARASFDKPAHGSLAPSWTREMSVRARVRAAARAFFCPEVFSRVIPMRDGSQRFFWSSTTSVMLCRVAMDRFTPFSRKTRYSTIFIPTSVLSRKGPVQRKAWQA